jgi:NAD(P)-dependent dehydrogenase (short-subunit alcohol dehydrogenase family)
MKISAHKKQQPYPQQAKHQVKMTLMNQKICIITGGNAGIGKAAAVQIAQKAEWHVIIACRSQERGEIALSQIKEQSGSDAVELMIVDMSSQASIRAFATAFENKYDRLDALIQNAAIFDISQTEAKHSVDDVETIWATNHLGPVLLTDLLLKKLKASNQGRVITIASKGLMAKRSLKIDLDDPEFRAKKFNPTNAYYQSKRAQIMYTYWLADQLKDTAVTVNCISVTSVQIDIDKYPNISGCMKQAYKLKSRFSLTPAEMAETYTWLATSEDVSNVSGKQFNENQKEVRSIAYTHQPQNLKYVMALTSRYLQYYKLLAVGEDSVLYPLN